MFVATFAFTIRTFFTGDLPFDSRPESTQAKRGEQLKALLVAKLDGISEGLDRVHPLRVRLSEGSATEVVIATCTDGRRRAIRDGLFNPGA